MRNIRTDLATEARDIRYAGIDADDAIQSEIKINGHDVTKLKIGEKSSNELKKPAGTYFSADLGEISFGGDEARDDAARLICELLKLILPENDGCILAVGLGNDRVTPDSVGPKAVKQIVVTRHVKALDPQLYKRMDFGECAAIITGVLGDTGVESADIIKGVAESVKPSVIIVIDALAARSMERLGKTVQLSDAGIAPGSGVNNRRAEISARTMGFPVISIGFPTVVDASTLTLDMLEDAGVGEETLATAENKISGRNRPSLFVSPKECDTMTDALGSIAAKAVNLYVHGALI